MLELRFKNYRVEIVDDPTFSVNSADNTINYDSVYGDDEYHSSKHGVLVYEGDCLRRSALVYAGAGATTVHENSAIVCDGAVFLCGGARLFSLSLPGLELRWARKVDDACCFGVFAYDEDLIVHGELNVSRVDQDGNVKWSASFADITVTQDGGSSFRMNPQSIEVIDWLNNRYSVDYQSGRSVMLS